MSETVLIFNFFVQKDKKYIKNMERVKCFHSQTEETFITNLSDGHSRKKGTNIQTTMSLNNLIKWCNNFFFF